MTPLGRHYLIEMTGCPPGLLQEPALIESNLRQAAVAMGATVVQSVFHHFAPLGVSGVVIIQESHLTIHTWPEHGYAAVDIFTCGKMDVRLAVDWLTEKLGATDTSLREMHRGVF